MRTASYANIAIVTHASGLDPPAPLPKRDQPILAAAIACGATHLLTGDIQHSGALMDAPERTGSVLVQTVAQFLRFLDKTGSQGVG